MINHDEQLKLQAYRDGELADREAAEVQALLAASAEARELLAELQFTSAALTGHEAEIKHPESHDFFWSKVRREIERPEPAPTAAPKRSLAGWFVWRFVPVGAMMVLSVSLVILYAHSRQLPPQQSGASEFASAGEMELASADMEADTYSDQQENTDYVWLHAREDSSNVQPMPADNSPSQ